MFVAANSKRHRYHEAKKRFMFDDFYQAHVIRNALVDAGIPAQINGESLPYVGAGSASNCAKCGLKNQTLKKQERPSRDYKQTQHRVRKPTFGHTTNSTYRISWESCYWLHIIGGLAMDAQTISNRSCHRINCLYDFVIVSYRRRRFSMRNPDVEKLSYLTIDWFKATDHQLLTKRFPSTNRSLGL